MVSIVIPVYNRKDYLEEMIVCVINQTYQNWELLLIDDGSTNDTIELMEEFSSKDKRIKVLKRESLPKGAPVCRNIGLNNACGEYIVFFDSDDIITKTCIQKRVEFMETHKDIDFAIFPAISFNELSELNNKKIYQITSVEGLELDKNNLLSVIRGEYPFLVWTNIYRKDILNNNKIFWNTRLSVYQDLDFTFQVLTRDLKFAFSNNSSMPDYYVRRHNQGKISTNLKTKEKYESAILVISEMISWIKNENNSKKYKLNEIYGFILFQYQKIKEDRRILGEYIVFCNKYFSKYFIFRLKILSIFLYKRKINFSLIKFLLFPKLFVRWVKIKKIKYKNIKRIKTSRFANMDDYQLI